MTQQYVNIVVEAPGSKDLAQAQAAAVVATNAAISADADAQSASTSANVAVVSQAGAQTAQGLAEAARDVVLAATAQTFVNALAILNRTDGGFGAGAIWRAGKEGISYIEADPLAIDPALPQITTAVGTVLYVQPGENGRYDVAAWGVRPSPNVTTAALQAAANWGVPFQIAPGNYEINAPIQCADGFDLEGSGRRFARIFQNTPDTAHFRANNTESLRFRGIRLTGAANSTGAGGDGTNRGAIHVNGVTRLEVMFCEFDRLPASGVIVNLNAGFSPLRYSGGIIAYNTFNRVAGSLPDLINPDGLQDGAPVALHHFVRGMQVIGNRCVGRWSVGIRAFEFFSSGRSAIRDLTIRDNFIDGADRYGMFFYALNPLVVSSFTDNGSGVFRATFTTPHHCDTGDVMHIGNAGTASGIWRITWISDTEFDLDGSVFQAGSDAASAVVRTSRSVEAIIEGNTVQNILGSTTAPPELGGGKPYGAGIYFQGVGGILARDNRIRRSNIETNSLSLTPGAYGINGATGPITILGGVIEDAEYDGVVINNQNANQAWFGSIFVGGGIQILRTNREALRLTYPQRTTIDGVEIQTRSIQAGRGGIFCPDSSGSGIADPAFVRMRNINIEWTATSGASPIELNRLTDFEMVNVSAFNRRPASQAVEVIRLLNCNRGKVNGCTFDGNLSAFPAVVITGTQNTLFSGNYARMTSDGAARATVTITGTCTGTVWDETNDYVNGRMNNQSTGGRMYTRAGVNNSGSLTRQIGDIIYNNAFQLTAGQNVVMWLKTAASAGGTNWREIRPTAAGTATFTAATSVAVTLSPTRPDANYSVALVPSADRRAWITSKTNTGFTINVDSSLTGSVDWTVNQHGA